MGIQIAAVSDKDLRGPYPRKTFMELTCDMNHGLMPPPSKRFTSGDYIVDFSKAMKLGWKERHDDKKGRLFLCPSCSGK